LTDKQENILRAALQLFADEGYNAVSTNRIAKEAGVSEGLIFKHFSNKQGLLDAIMKHGAQKISQVIEPVLSESDPKLALRKWIETPYNIPQDEYSFWKLYFKLKWNSNYYDPTLAEPLLSRMEACFEASGYENPRSEAVLLEKVSEGISQSILQEGLEKHIAFKEFLLNKYNL